MKVQSYAVIAAGLIWCAGALRAQTTAINLSQQARIQSSTQLPTQCTEGQMFVVTGAPAGPVLYVCAQPNTWSAPSPYTAGEGVVLSGSNIAADDAVTPVYYAGAGAPTLSCMAGRDWYVDTAAGNLYYCISSGQWQAAAGLAANTFPAGQRQSMTHDGTNAGLRLVPAAGDPAGAQDGDVWYNLSTGKFRRRENGVATDWDAALAAHNLLSSAHGDTTPAAVTRGDLITGQGASAAWTRLALGAGGSYLRSNGTDLAYAQIATADLPSGYSWSNLANVPSTFAPPAPTSSTLGGVKAVDCSSGSQFLQKINTDGSETCATPSGGGSVSGPGSSTDGYIPLWSGATGTLLKTGISASTFQAALTTGTQDQYLNGVLGLGSWVNCVANGGVLQYSTASHAVTCHTLTGADLPAPTSSSLGGVRSLAAVAHQWINAISTSGIPSAAQPACGDLSNAAASCSTDTTNAGNISSGTLSRPAVENWTVGAIAVTANTLVALDGSNPEKVIPVTTSATTAYGLALDSGASGATVRVQRQGPAQCYADNAVTPGDVVIVGTGTAGYCRDSGYSNSNSVSITTGVIGVVTQSASAGALMSLELTIPHRGYQVPAAQVTGLAPSASTDTTNAGNISSGTLPAARLPAPTTTTLGGVESQNCTGTGHVLSINTDGSVSCSADAGGSGGGGGAVIAAGGAGMICISGDCHAPGVASLTYTANRVYYFQEIFWGQISVSNLLVYVTPGTASTAHYALALMDKNCNLVSGSGINYTSTANTGFYTSTAFSNPVTVGPGVYYLAFVTDASTATLYSWSANSYFPNNGYPGSAPRDFYGATAPTGSGPTLAVPGSCGTRNTLSTPEFYSPIFWVAP